MRGISRRQMGHELVWPLEEARAWDRLVVWGTWGRGFGGRIMMGSR